MTKINLDRASTQKLIELYVEIGGTMGLYAETFQISKYNRLFKKKRAIEEQLKHRSGDHRNHLFELYTHKNMQVRLNAVHATYALDPKRSEAEFRAIYETRREPWASDAGMALAMLEMGISQLPNDP